MATDQAVVDQATVRVAAGLIGWDAIDELSVDDLTDQLRSQLSPSALWAPAGAGGQALGDLHALGRPGHWRARGPVEPATQGRLQEAWSAAVSGYRTRGEHAVLRLLVDSIDDAAELSAIGEAGPFRIVAVVGRFNHRFSWRWPMRVAVADGPEANGWVGRLEQGEFANHLYEVRLAHPGDSGPIEILILDGDAGSFDQLALIERPACIAVVGSSRPAGELLARAVDAFDPSVAFVVPHRDVDWFGSFITELAHDQPVDVAVTFAAPGATVVGNPEFIDATAVGRWTAELAGQLGAAEANLLENLVASTAFDRERHGATQVADAARNLSNAGVDTTVRRGMPMAAAPPPIPEMEAGADEEEEEEEEAGAAPPRRAARAPRRAARARKPKPKPRPGTAAQRYLLAELMRDGVKQAAALPPHADHTLEVWIGVPVQPEAAPGVVFDESRVRDSATGKVRLTLDVTDVDAGFHATAPIELSTRDRAKATERAVFKFQSGEDGTGVNFKIVVLHEGRPIQAMRVVGRVADTAGPNDVIQYLRVPLSADPEPSPTVTGADVTLDFTDARKVVRLGDVPPGAVANFDDVLALLNQVEQRASQVLGVTDAPSKLSDDGARELLIELAVIGKQLRDKLADLLIDDAAKTIAVLVSYDSQVLPIELTYDGPRPNKSAELCEHVKKPPRDGERCTHASKRIVCPYAFWGMRRVIARTIERRLSDPIVRPRVERLRLHPVLYAATTVADRDAPLSALPSDLLEKELATIVGRRRLVRVTSWSTWKSMISKRKPQMLVVLGHTESAGDEASLFIGRNSQLKAASIERNVLGGKTTAPPLLLLLACESAVIGGVFGALPATFTGKGAGAVVATLSKLTGPHGAAAAAEIVRSLQASSSSETVTLGTALMRARRTLVGSGLLVGLLLVSHGEIDLALKS